MYHSILRTAFLPLFNMMHFHSELTYTLTDKILTTQTWRVYSDLLIKRFTRRIISFLDILKVWNSFMISCSICENAHHNDWLLILKSSSNDCWIYQHEHCSTDLHIVYLSSNWSNITSPFSKVEKRWGCWIPASLCLFQDISKISRVICRQWNI